jgi:hypothetical protein
MVKDNAAIHIGGGLHVKEGGGYYMTHNAGYVTTQSLAVKCVMVSEQYSYTRYLKTGNGRFAVH